jgi:hypothetical protein
LQPEDICAPCESWTGDVDYGCAEGAAGGTGNEALSSSLVIVSSLILVHGVFDTRVGFKVLYVHRTSTEPT